MGARSGEIEAAFGEYLPSFVQDLVEESELYAATTAVLDALKAALSRGHA